MKKYICMWQGKEVRPTPTSCFWVFGDAPECSSYHEPENKKEKGRCVFLHDLEDLEGLVTDTND